MKIRCLAVPALLTAALFLGACHSDQTKPAPKATPAAKPAGSMGMMNSKCPMKPGEALDSDSPSETYNGQKVGFCCKGCMAKFNGLSDADKSAKLAAAK